MGEKNRSAKIQKQDILIQGNGIVIIGCGGHGKKMLDVCFDNDIHVHGFLAEGNYDFPIMGKEILGYLESYMNNDFYENVPYHIAIGDTYSRMKVFETINETRTPFSIISKHSVLHSCNVGKGCSVNSGAIMQTNSVLGNYCILDSGAILEHDSKVGDFVNIHPRAVICGSVEIGEGAVIGAGSVVRERIKIGRNAIVGAGSVIVKDVPENTIVVGNPARFLKKRELNSKYLK